MQFFVVTSSSFLLRECRTVWGMLLMVISGSLIELWNVEREVNVRALRAQKEGKDRRQ